MKPTTSYRRFLKTSFRPVIALALGTMVAADGNPVFPEDPVAWPAVTRTSKPWTRWWWLGSAVDPANLTREIEGFARAGVGGVEICPIYGAMGAEDRFIEFLSPKWMDMLAHTTREAGRVGIGVDMTTGTGWPFGGPMVTKDMASCSLQRITRAATGGGKVSFKLPDGKLQCLLAWPETGNPVDLTDHVKSGKLDWSPPAGKWTICGLAARSQIQKVKRSAPGGEGNVLDPFSPAAMKSYVGAFDHAFAGFTAPKPRAQFHDSFEYYGADWTTGFPDAFRTARGYDLRSQLPAFYGYGDPDTIARVRADYRETLGELHLGYLRSWHDWARMNGGITRNQAHGSPGNLLDHYAVSEIPETEIFRQVDESQIPMIRFAVSAANSKGGSLVSSETFTWLGEHFQVTPEQLKEAADFVFLGGVNHLFFHGIPCSPQDVPWPGWLFYASTHMGPNGGLWRDLPAFNGYIQRCQSILQDGKPTSDVLIYFPYEDLIHDGAEKLPLFTVHNQDSWLHPTQFYQAAMELWNHGITFDFASDDMLTRATVRDGRIQLGGNSFRTLVLPGVKHLAPATMGKILSLAAEGGSVLIKDGWPADVPGFHDFEKRRATLLAMETEGKPGITKAAGSILPALARIGVHQEPMTESGLRFVRRSHGEGFHYFIVNRSARVFEGKLPLAVPFRSAVVMDPWNPAANRVVNQTDIALRLDPGQSIIIRTFTDKSIAGKPWSLPPPAVETITLDRPWKLEFLEGGPVLPKPVTLPSLVSWTTLPDHAALNFSGTARYSTGFDHRGAVDAPARLDLGKVANTARVFLNGGEVGVSWCKPHVLDVSGHLKSGENQLVIEVTNLAANRIADLDRRKVPWKRFHEINFVSANYGPFDASAWPPLESGLLGPVTLATGSKP